jgi:hypothetical protein
MGITFDTVYTDNWNSFIAVFQTDNHIIGKENTKGIEGNNCRLRHRIRRAFRKTCCFSKKLFNHLKAFELAFFYMLLPFFVWIHIFSGRYFIMKKSVILQYGKSRRDIGKDTVAHRRIVEDIGCESK